MRTVIQPPRTLAALLLVVSLGCADLSAAQDKTGWSVSGVVGVSQIRDEDSTDTFDGNSLGLAADFEYRFTPNFTLGLGLFSLGRADDVFEGVETEIAVRGFSLFGRVIQPLSDSVDFYGRIGAAVYYVDIDPGGVGLADLFGEDAVERGIGIDFGRRERLAYRLEGRYYNGGKDETGALITAGFNYLFH